MKSFQIADGGHLSSRVKGLLVPAVQSGAKNQDCKIPGYASSESDGGVEGVSNCVNCFSSRSHTDNGRAFLPRVFRLI
jgi:hypothetical protein